VWSYCSIILSEIKTYGLLCNALNITKWPIKLAIFKVTLVLFYNLFTCAQGHGNPCNYLLGVPPPTVEEYLYSANNNLLVPLIIHDDKDDHFENENAEDEALYYHIIFNDNPNNSN
jgi:hypothetical protein